MLSLWLAWSLCGAARADAPWYRGLPIAQVSIEAPGGDLPRENLAPLLRTAEAAQNAAIFNPADVRADLVMLQSVGAFEAVQVQAERTVLIDDEGEPALAVWLIFQVWPAPAWRRIRFDGNRALRTAELLQAAGLSSGAPFFPDQDLPAIEARLLSHYAREGFVGTRVALETHLVEPGRFDLRIVIDEGTPLILGALSFSGDGIYDTWAELRVARERGALALSPWRRFWLLRSQGLRVGRRYAPDDVTRLAEALEAELRGGGWAQAAVQPLYLPPDADVEGDRLLYVIRDADMRAVIEATGRGLPGRAALAEILEPGRPGRYTDAFLEESEVRLEEGLQEKGWLDARVGVVVRDEGAVRRVSVTADTGPRYRLARGGISFTGASAISGGDLADALRAASPDVLGRRRATEDAVREALPRLVDLYRTHGRLDADLTLTSLRTDGRGGRRIAIAIAVDEGSLTRLDNLRIVGAAPQVIDALEDEIFSWLGEPLNPAAIASLSRQIADGHRSLGYLSADAVARTTIEDGSGEVVIRVTPGEQIFLRNLLVRGLGRTRRRVIEAEVVLETGDSLSPEALANVRSELYDLDLFSTVRTDLVGEDERARDLLIEVQERPQLAIEVGGGVNTDEGVRAFSRATRRNLFGLAHRLHGLGQVGLGYTGDTFLLDTTSLEWRAALRYEAPHLPFEDQRIFTDLLLAEQELEPTWRMERSGVGVGVEMELGRLSSLVIEYRLQRRVLEDVDPGALVNGDPWLDVLGVDDPTDEALTFPVGPRNVSGAGALYLLDSRDDRFNPTRGAFFSLRVDLWDALLAPAWMVKGLGLGGVVVPMGSYSLRLGGQIGAGWMQGFAATLPVEERFRLGGVRTLRGYALDSVGPKNNVSLQELSWPSEIEPPVDYLGRDDLERWVPTGGDAIALLRGELWIPLSELGFNSDSTSLVVFGDGGNVFFLSPTVLTSSGPRPLFGAFVGDEEPEPIVRYGVGLGLRFATAVGPLQMDIGFNPLYEAGGWTEARGEVPARFHLALGAL